MYDVQKIIQLMIPHLSVLVIGQDPTSLVLERR
jgi:hypothetical protein